MKPGLASILLFGLGGLVLSATARGQGAVSRPGSPGELEVVALTHAQVIDGTGAAAREDQTLLIQGGRILLLGPSDRTKLPAKARVLNLRGRSVLPGLVMLHEHLFWVYEVVRGIGISHPQHHSFPRMYLAHGVTTLRTAGADFPYMDLKLKRRIDSGELPGPEIHLTSPYFSGDGDPFLGAMDVRSGDDARRVVRYWAAEGFTSFKAYQSVRREVLAAMIDEAHRLKLPVTAHLGETMSCREAAELGIDNIEHGCAETRDDVEPDMNGPKTQALVRALIERHVVLTVTPVDGLRPMPDAVRNLYDPSARERYARVITAIRSRRPASSSEEDPTATPSAHFLRSFAMAGGRLVLGSDSGSMGNVPGRADQEALENLVRCGFTPLEAIRVATLDGATFLGIQDRTGSIQAGKEADLLVVRGNPLQRIEDIENVERVFANGKAYDPKVLLAEVKGELGWH